jgi:hypothetical protein
MELLRRRRTANGRNAVLQLAVTSRHSRILKKDRKCVLQTRRSALLLARPPPLDLPPDSEVTRKVGPRVRSFDGTLRRLLVLLRALPRIRHAEAGCYDKHIWQNIFRTRPQQHPAQCWVHWQTRKFSPPSGQPIQFVKRTQFMQKPVTGPYRSHLRRVDEREAFRSHRVQTPSCEE